MFSIPYVKENPENGVHLARRLSYTLDSPYRYAEHWGRMQNAVLQNSLFIWPKGGLWRHEYELWLDSGGAGHFTTRSDLCALVIFTGQGIGIDALNSVGVSNSCFSADSFSSKRLDRSIALWQSFYFAISGLKSWTSAILFFCEQIQKCGNLQIVPCRPFSVSYPPACHDMHTYICFDFVTVLSSRSVFGCVLLAKPAFVSATNLVIL